MIGKRLNIYLSDSTITLLKQKRQENPSFNLSKHICNLLKTSPNYGLVASFSELENHVRSLRKSLNEVHFYLQNFKKEGGASFQESITSYTKSYKLILHELIEMGHEHVNQ